jgi:uncharacterized repeat protein (TIGR01451 family)
MKYRVLNGVAVAAMLFSLAAQTRAAPLATAPQPQPLASSGSAAGWDIHAPGKTNTGRNLHVLDVVGETDPNGATPATYIVQLAAAPLASYRGGVNGLAATSPSATGVRLSTPGGASVAYRDFLRGEQAEMLARIEARLGRLLAVIFTYDTAFHGFAIVLTPKEAAIVAGMGGVSMVQRDGLAQLHTDHGPGWIHAPGIWTGDQITSTRGEGMVVGIIDTGINFASPSFAGVGGDGFTHSNPRGRLYGVCDPGSAVYDPEFVCNDKLIGAWDFVDLFGRESDGPEDSDGHGSHTASTVAGNQVTQSLAAPTYEYSATISGVAPHASIIAYDACYAAGCPYSSLLAAVNQAVADEVDVINFSIGGASFDPWLTSSAQGMLAALDAGIFTAVSAGNSGPGVSTMSSPANAPWVTAVAAATHDRRLLNMVVDLSGGDTTPPADIPGESITAGYGPAALVDAEAFGDPLCQGPFPSDTFTGQIVVCERGINGRVEKGENVLAGGAGGMILVNDEANGDSLIADTHVLPAVHISYDDGVALKTWLASGSGHMGRIAGTNVDVANANGDILASFSSRGPDATLPDVLKPDATAPGVSIFAAYKHPEGYNFVSGTSMAAPHVAGAATLLAALYPAWSPSALRSALMLTAKTAVRKEDGTTQAGPFDSGAGRIDVAAAAKTGFVLDATAYDFELADPFIGGDPTTLNLASLSNAACIGACTWTRTLRSVQATAETYTVTWTSPPSLTLSVEPAAFILPPGGVQVITVTADVNAAGIDAWIFGQVDVNASNPALSDTHLPVAVYSRAGFLGATANTLRLGTRQNQGQYILEGVRSVPTDTLVKAFYAGVASTISDTVGPDPTFVWPYDIAAGGVYTTLLPVSDPETVLLSVQIVEATALDFDLYVGLDANDDGLPSEDELECVSALAGSFEECILNQPSLGDYWVLVQNYEGSGASFDSFTLEVVRVVRGAQSENFTVTGPTTTQLHEPFDLSLAWNLPDFAPGDVRRGLLEVGTDDVNPNNVLSLPVILTRLTDELSGSVETPTVAQPGSIVTYSLQLATEPTAISPAGYTVTATLPAALEYLPGSSLMSSSAGATSVDPILSGNQLVWQLENVQTQPRYVMSTNDPASPLYDEGCATPFGSTYLPLATVGYPLWPAANGDGQTWHVDEVLGYTDWFLFDGAGHPRLYFTDDALLSVIGFDERLNSGINTPIPSPALPNYLIAPYWADFEVVYDPEAQTGVRVGSAFDGALVVVDYNGLQRVDGFPGSLDVQALIWRRISAAYPEIVFAYNNINAPPPGVIGIEDGTGSEGLAYTGEIHDNLLICFNWQADQVELAYAVQVQEEAPLDSTQTTTFQSRLHTSETPDSDEETTITVDLFVTGVLLEITSSSPPQVAPGNPISYTYTVQNNGARTAENVVVTAQLPPGSQHVAGGALKGDLVSFTIPTLAPGATTTLAYGVLMKDPALTAAQAQAPEIIGGEEAAPGAWPWMVALWNNSTDRWYGCGGSLISREWVLTAAHCITNDGRTSVTPASSLSVVAGRHDLTTNTGQRIQVSEVIYHPGYNLASFSDADIALLRLAEPVTLAGSVQPVKLATQGDGARFAAGVVATVTGWGTRTSGAQDFPDALHQVEVPIVDFATCQARYEDAILGRVTGNMLCAGVPEGGKDSCQGDSGGPLVVPDGANGWLQAGVVSWGNLCALPTWPGVYTRVANFTGWVDDAQDTLTAGPYLASDGTGLPGHSAEGAVFGSTLVRPITLYMPIIEE